MQEESPGARERERGGAESPARLNAGLKELGEKENKVSLRVRKQEQQL